MIHRNERVCRISSDWILDTEKKVIFIFAYDLLALIERIFIFFLLLVLLFAHQSCVHECLCQRLLNAIDTISMSRSYDALIFRCQNNPHLDVSEPKEEEKTPNKPMLSTTSSTTTL